MVESHNGDAAVSQQQESTYCVLRLGDVSVKVARFGGKIMSLIVPDRDGNPTDVVLGYAEVDDYKKENASPYFGAIIGRVGNRIAGAKYTDPYTKEEVLLSVGVILLMGSTNFLLFPRGRDNCLHRGRDN